MVPDASALLGEAIWEAHRGPYVIAPYFKPPSKHPEAPALYPRAHLRAPWSACESKHELLLQEVQRLWSEMLVQGSKGLIARSLGLSEEVEWIIDESREAQAGSALLLTSTP